MFRAPVRVIGVASLVLLSALLAACNPSAIDSHGPGTGGIVAHVVWVTGGAQPAAYHPDLRASPLTVPSEVVTIRATVTASGMSTVQATFSASSNPTGGVIGNVPAGTNRTLAISGLDGASNVIYSGQTSGITVTTGQTTDAGTVYLTQTGSSTSIGSWSPGTNAMPTARWEAATVELDGLIYVIGGYNGTYLSTVEAYDPITGTWSPKSSLTNARAQAAAVALDGKIYVIAGGDATTYMKSMEIYDPTTNSWSAGTDMPSSVSPPREGVTAAALNGKIYVIGGYNENSTPPVLDTVAVFDPSTGTWSAGTPLLTGRNGASASVLHGEIYVSGGYNGSAALKSMEAFTPSASGGGVTGTWASEGSLNTARDFHATTVLDGKIYALGGFDGNSVFYGSVEAYNTATDTWSVVTSIPTGRAGLGAIAFNGQIYAIGGGNALNSYLSDVQVYTPPANAGANTWANVSPSSGSFSTREGVTAVEANGIVYAIGGYDGSAYLSTVEAYDPVANTVTSKSSLPALRALAAGADIDGTVYVAGGQDSSQSWNTLYGYSTLTGSWATLPSMTYNRSGPAAAAVDGKLYVFGGYNGSYLNTVEAYDPATNTWTSKATMPTARADAAAVAVHGIIYVIGGTYDNAGSTGYSSAVEAYNPRTNTWTSKSSTGWTARAYIAAAEVHGKIYVAGGEDASLVYIRTEAFDPATNTWTPYTSLNSMNTARSYVSGATANGRMYAVAGYTLDQSSNIVYLSTVERYTP